MDKGLFGLSSSLLIPSRMDSGLHTTRGHSSFKSYAPQELSHHSSHPLGPHTYPSWAPMFCSVPQEMWRLHTVSLHLARTSKCSCSTVCSLSFHSITGFSTPLITSSLIESSPLHSSPSDTSCPIISAETLDLWSVKSLAFFHLSQDTSSTFWPQPRPAKPSLRTLLPCQTSQAEGAHSLTF